MKWIATLLNEGRGLHCAMTRKGRYKPVLSLMALLFVLSLLLCSEAGMAAVVIPTSVPVTERAGSRLVFYWDLRNRQSYFQVTNEGSSTVKIHVQVWNASSSTCAQFDFIDTLTPFDSHVYNVSALDRNDGQPLAAPTLSGGHGFVAVTSVDNTGAFLQADSLTGNFTVVDLAGGYLYRTNAAVLENTPSRTNYTFHFNNIDPIPKADVVVMSFTAVSGPPAGVAPLSSSWTVTLTDENENQISCPTVEFGCPRTNFPPLINVGINSLIQNSRAGPSLCPGTNNTGYVTISNVRKIGDVGIGSITELDVGFVGINGSMDLVIGK